MSAGEIKKLTYSSGVTTAAPTVSNPTESITLTENTITTGTYSNYDATGVSYIAANTSGGDITINGLANGSEGQVLFIAKVSSANNLYINYVSGSAASTDKIYCGDVDTSMSKYIMEAGFYGGLTLIHTGASWWVVGKDMRSTQNGTFTPAITGATTGPTAVTYTSQVGRYWRFGQLLHFTIDIRWSTWTGSPTGDFLIQTGLPDCYGRDSAISIGSFYTLPLTTNYTQVFSEFTISSNTINFKEQNSSTGAEQAYDWSLVPASGTKVIRVSGFYNID